MNITRREAIKAVAVATAALSLGIATGCNKSTIAALVQELGVSTANLATLLGSAALSTEITSLTNVAVQDINNWQAGSTSQMAIQALNDLAAALGQIPILAADPTVEAVVTLALGTIAGLLALIPVPAQPPAALKAARQLPTISNPPQTKGEFRSRWNALVKSARDSRVRKAHRGLL
jgi:hypothetical protein